HKLVRRRTLHPRNGKGTQSYAGLGSQNYIYHRACGTILFAPPWRGQGPRSRRSGCSRSCAALAPMKYGAVPFLTFMCLLPDAAQAHAFEVPYVLPIPFWVYAYSCMAMLVVSFAAVGYFSVTSDAGTVSLSVEAEPKGFYGTVGSLTLLVLRCG